MNIQHLLFLPEQAARDRLFLRDLFATIPKLKGDVFLAHETGAERVEVNRYVSKRISANLSEAMDPNLWFSGDQRNLVAGNTPDELFLDAEKLSNLAAGVHTVICSCTAIVKGTPQAVEPAAFLAAVKDALRPREITLFTNNPQSALNTEARLIETTEGIAPLRTAFPEEEKILQIAGALSPASINTPARLQQ